VILMNSEAGRSNTYPSAAVPDQRQRPQTWYAEIDAGSSQLECRWTGKFLLLVVFASAIQ